MKRREYLATVNGEARGTYAWNSAIRMTEAMVGEMARSEGDIYAGDPPTLETEPKVYRRTWQATRSGLLAFAEVREA